tara:strand:- start:8792 stop:9088 length:297 start_codon:yes stop_codon:yes gene_type:complete
MFHYKLSFGDGVNVKVVSKADQEAGKVIVQGQLGDAEEVKKYMSANGVDCSNDSPMNVATCLKGWDWNFEVVTEWKSPSSGGGWNPLAGAKSGNSEEE